MGKPLLTDEIIERAARGEDISGPPLMDDEETKILTSHDSPFGYSSPGRASRISPTEESLSDQAFGYSSPQPTGMSEDTMQIEVEPTVTKSRRIENQKRGIFQAKLNKILLGILLLLAILIAAIIWL